MLIKNALVGNKIADINTENGVITEIGTKLCGDGIDAEGKRVIPGLIDVHTHGYGGFDTMGADFEPMCRIYAKNGTTSFLPTTMTMGYDDIKTVCDAKTGFSGAEILGFHLEGPYISKKYKGAQNEKYIKSPDIKGFKQFNNVKMITIAPELDGSQEFIREVSKSAVVSIGHTDCDYETAVDAIECGANCLTHTYNAMPPLHHRNSGPIGAAIEKNIYAQLICDGMHISKPVVLSTYRTFSSDRVVLISDSLSCGGLPDGEYVSGGLKVILKNNTAKLPDGTIAGSTATLWDCVKKAVRFGIPFDDAVKMATKTPADMLGIKKGRIAAGYDADLLIIGEKLNIEKVIIAGEVF